MNRLKDLREDNDLLQKDIAKFLQLDRSTYSDYETNSLNISVNYLKKLSRFYNTSIDYILYKTDKREPYSFFNYESSSNKNRLKELRISINKTQREIAMELNMPLKTYIKYEHGERSLNTQVLNIFADYYNASTDYIIYNTDEIKPYKKSRVDWSKEKN